MRRLLGISALVALIAVVGGGCSSSGGHDAGAASATTTTAVSVASIASVHAVVAKCPPTLNQGAAQAGTGNRHALVANTATAVRVCKYAALMAKDANALVGSGLVTDATAARRLEAGANALHHISNAERIPCPLNPNTAGWTIVFKGGGSSTTLVVAASDCGFVTNGSITASPSTSWLAALARVAKNQ